MNDFVEKKKKWVFNTRNKLLKKHFPGQDDFKKLLDQATVFYVREQPSFSCYSPNICFMDFYVPYYSLDIEIDGRQHRFEDRLDKDISKKDFLWNDRIATLRLPNEEVAKMKDIDMTELFERVSENQRIEIEQIKKNQKEGWILFYSRHHIKIDKSIWLYFKENRKTYCFDNILELQRSIHYDENKVLGVLNKEVRSNFLVSFDMEELSDMVVKWKKEFYKK